MLLSRWSKKQVCATQVKILRFVFVVLFFHTTRHAGSQFPDQGSNSKKQECGVLTTDCQGSPKILLFLNTTKQCYNFCTFSKILFKPIHLFLCFSTERSLSWSSRPNQTKYSQDQQPGYLTFKRYNWSSEKNSGLEFGTCQHTDDN